MAKRSAADWTAEDLARQAEAAASLIEYLQQAHEDDDDLVNDSIEGETDFLETIDRALEQIAEADMMTAALKQREAELAQRRKRHELKSEFLRGCVSMAMAMANGDINDRPLPFTLMTPAATVTLKEGKPKIIVDDEALLPARFWRTPDPIVDKAALNAFVAQVLAGPDADVVDDEDAQPLEVPAGVTITDAGFSLTIRRK